MAYPQQIAVNHYVSWDHKLTIQQEIRQISDKNGTYQETKLSVSNSSTKTDKETEWIRYPFSHNQTIYTVLLDQVPELKKEDISLPIVEITYKYRKHGLSCSSYLLKNGKLFKLYRPIVATIKDYELISQNNMSIFLSNGEDVCSAKFSDVAMILEE